MFLNPKITKKQTQDVNKWAFYLVLVQKNIRTDEIASLLNLTSSQVSNDYRNYKIDSKGLRKSNGRPALVKDSDLQFIKNWLDAFVIPPRYKEVKNFIMEHCAKVLHHSTITTILLTPRKLLTIMILLQLSHQRIMSLPH